MRKMATVRKIDEIRPIEGADRIEQVMIGGWSCVSQKGLHHEGKYIVYCEPDSILPVKEEYEYLSNFYIDKHGFKGYRVKSIKLKKTQSQGVILPLGDLPEEEGYDATEHLGIVKYEPPIPAELAGQVKGNFPSFLERTNEERAQNLTDKDLMYIDGKVLQITEKLDGTSMTVYRNGDIGVCSRNLEMKEVEGNTMWKLAREFEDKIPDGICVQGELIGPGIQGNKYKLNEPTFFMFTVYDIKEGKRLPLDTVDIETVPAVGAINFTYTSKVDSIERLLTMADGQSKLAQVKREGLVFRNLEHNISFKAISNKWLEKNDE